MNLKISSWVYSTMGLWYKKFSQIFAVCFILSVSLHYYFSFPSPSLSSSWSFFFPPMTVYAKYGDSIQASILINDEASFLDSIYLLWPYWPPLRKLIYLSLKHLERVENPTVYESSSVFSSEILLNVPHHALHSGVFAPLIRGRDRDFLPFPQCN